MVLAVPAAAGAAIGDLTFAECLGDKGSACTLSPAPEATVELARAAVSPNGRSLYLTSNRGSVTHYSVDGSGRLAFDSCITTRNMSDEACTFVSQERNVLSGAAGVAVSPNGNSVFVASTSGSSDDVAHFFADPTTGHFSFDGCISDDGSEGHCANAKLGAVNFNPLEAEAVVVAPSGGAVYVSGSIAVSRLVTDPDGRLSFGECLDNEGNAGCGKFPSGGRPLIGSQSIAISPNGRSLYVTSGGGSPEFLESGDVGHLFAEPAGGPFSWDGCVSSDGSGGTCADVPGPGQVLENSSALTVSPDGADVYAISDIQGTLVHLRTLKPETGQIAFADCIESKVEAGCAQSLPGPGLLQSARSIAVSPDGRSVYVTGGDNIDVFARNTSTGVATFQGCLTNGSIPGCTMIPGKSLESTRSVALSPDGASVYVVSAEAVTRFARTTTEAASCPCGPGGGGPKETGTGTKGFTRTQLKASLMSQLSPKGKKAKLASIAARRNYSYAFTALEAGKATVAWYFVPKGAHVSTVAARGTAGARGVAAKKKPKPVLIASGALTFKAAGTHKLKVTLTRAGRARLAHRGALKLTSKGTFKPNTEAAVVATKTFTLRG